MSLAGVNIPPHLYDDERDAAVPAVGAVRAPDHGYSPRTLRSVSPWEAFQAIMRMLIVEDDIALARALATGFRDEGFAVDLESTGPDGLRAASAGEHDIVILDLMLPGMDGYGVLKELRRLEVDVPVLVLTARDALKDRVRGLKAGGDDYLSKPFAFEELLARVRNLVRRAHGVARSRLAWKALSLDQDTRRVTWDGEPIGLTPREFAILEALLLERGVVLTRGHLIACVYDGGFDCDSNVIDAHMANLRRKIRQVAGLNPIATIRGVGFVVPEEVDEAEEGA